jgi:hypothetical protein
MYNDYFKFTGLNIFNLLVPQQGVTWVFEAIKLGFPSVGDIRITAFSAPIIIAGIYIFLKTRFALDELSKSVLCVFMISLYLSFGPTLQLPNFAKIDFSNISESLTVFSIEKFYLIPTGSELIYKYLPGFNSMRVTFRWVALAIFMLWLFVVINTREKSIVDKKIVFFFLLSILISTPNLFSWVNYSIHQRVLFAELELKFVIPLSKLIKEGEVVAFLPWTNDMAVPYAASRGNYRTLNVAGDKNILSAKSNWPDLFAKFGDISSANITASDAPVVVSILANREADVIVIPNIIKLWGLNNLPCTVMGPIKQEVEKVKLRGEGFICPDSMLIFDPAIIKALSLDKRLDLLEYDYFTVVRLH